MNIQKVKEMFSDYIYSESELEDYLAYKIKDSDFDEIIKSLVSISVYAFEYGLLYCEKYCNDLEKKGNKCIKDVFYRTMLQLIIDGTDPKEVKFFYNNFIEAELKKIEVYYKLMKIGFDGIFTGINPRILNIKLKSIIGSFTKDDDEEMFKVWELEKLDTKCEDENNISISNKHWEKYEAKKEDECIENLKILNYNNLKGLIKVFHRLSETARREGVTELKKYCALINDENFKVGIDIMIDNAFEKYQSEFDFFEFNKFEQYFETVKDKKINEKKTYLRLVGTGVLLIQNAADSFYLYESLQLILGKNVFFEIKKNRDNFKMLISSEIIERLNEDEYYKTVNNLMYLMDDRSIRQVIKELYKSDFAIALCGFSEKSKNKIKENTSQECYPWMIDFAAEYSQNNDEMEKDILEVFKKIFEKIKYLEECGDIIVCRGRFEDDEDWARVINSGGNGEAEDSGSANK